MILTRFIMETTQLYPFLRARGQLHANFTSIEFRVRRPSVISRVELTVKTPRLALCLAFWGHDALLPS